MPLRSSFLSSYIDSAVNIVIVPVLVIFLSLPRVATKHYIRLVSSSHSSNSSFFRCRPPLPLVPPPLSFLPLSLSSIPRDTVQSSNPMKARPRSSSSTPLLLLVAITCQPSNSARTSWFPPILSRACAHQPPIKRPSYLLRARPCTIPADPSIGGAIKRWR